MKRRQQLITFGAGMVVLAGLVVALMGKSQFRRWAQTPALDLPPDDEVVEMRASLTHFQGTFRAIPEFTVPRSYVPVVLDWFRPGKHFPQGNLLDPFDELGEVVMKAKSGRELRLRFYFAGKGIMLFTPDGRHQFTGKATNSSGRDVDGGMSLRYCIEEAWQVSNGRKIWPEPKYSK